MCFKFFSISSVSQIFIDSNKQIHFPVLSEFISISYIIFRYQEEQAISQTFLSRALLLLEYYSEWIIQFIFYTSFVFAFVIVNQLSISDDKLGYRDSSNLI